MKSCFGKWYDYRAKECQICHFAIRCWEKSGTNSVKLNGHAIAILHIITQNKKATVEDIKEGLVLRFGNKTLNIYYYLTMLKKHSLIDVEITGRQRFYILR